MELYELLIKKGKEEGIIKNNELILVIKSINTGIE